MRSTNPLQLRRLVFDKEQDEFFGSFTVNQELFHYRIEILMFSLQLRSSLSRLNHFQTNLAVFEWISIGLRDPPPLSAQESFHEKSLCLII